MKIISRQAVGELPVYDIGLSKIHNYQLSNGLVTSNCFNKCLSKRILVKTLEDTKTIAELHRGEIIKSFDLKTNNEINTTLVAIHPNGYQKTYRVYMEDGSILDGVTLNHRFLCSDLQEHTLEEIFTRRLDILSSM